MSKRELLAKALERTGLGPLLSRTVGNWRGVLVFNYHRVGDPAQSPFDRALFSATQDVFDRQVRFIKKHFDVAVPAELDDVLAQGRRAVMLTFDDGYRDNSDFALPVLKQHQVPATFFITSGFLDDRPIAWWDEIAWMIRSASVTSLSLKSWGGGDFLLTDADAREAAIKQALNLFKRLPQEETAAFLSQLSEFTGSGRCPRELSDRLWMTWDMVRELDRCGMEIGGHTMTHPVLANTDLPTQRQEVLGCKNRIEAELGHPITAFSYPVGLPFSFTSETERLLDATGYRWAFSFSGGVCLTRTPNHFNLPRVPISPHVSQELFRSTARLPWLFA
jgi:peptidoglycan/xylan/chitin deacetylase (PgdA/CDA1 family)